MKTKSIFKGMGLPILLLIISIMFGLPNVSFGMNDDTSKEEVSYLSTTLPTSVPAGEWTNFDFIFTAPAGEYKSITLKVKSPNGKGVLLKYESTPDNWILRDLQSSGSFTINGLAFQSQTIKFQIAPVIMGNNSITFDVTPFSPSEPGQPSTETGETYTLTQEYSTTGECPLIDITPERLEFGTCDINKTYEKEFTISAAHLTADLTLTNPNAMYVLSQTIIPAATNGDVVIKVTYKPTTDKAHTASIKITGGGMLREKITFVISGKGFNPDAPRLEFDKTMLEFGSVNIGESEEIEFNVTPFNLTADITLSVTNGAIDYTVTPTTISKTATGAQTVKVKFTPTMGKKISGSVKLVTSGLTYYVSLIGTGVYATLESTLPNELEVGKSTEFNMTFTKIAGTFETVDMILNTNYPDAALLSYYNETSKSWVDLDLTTTNKDTMKGLAFATQTIKFKITAQKAGNERLNCDLINADGVRILNVFYNYKAVVVPIITVTPETLTFNATIGTAVTAKTVAVTGANLMADMAITLTGTNAAMFTQTTATGWSAKTGGTINIGYMPTAAGTHTATLTIISDDITKIVAITATATVPVPVIAVTPETLAFTATIGTAVTAKTITVTGANLAVDMAITLTGANAAMFTQTTATGWSAKTGGTINIGYNPTAAGTHTATLTITSGTATKTVTITATATAAPIPVITVTPETLVFTATIGTVVTAKTITVTGANLTADMSITLIGANAAMFTQTTATGWSAKTGGTINIGYNPTAAGTHAATLTITSGTVTKTVTITATATAAPVPVITVTPGNLDFNMIKLGASEPQVLTVIAKDLAADMTIEITGTDAKLFSKTLATDWNTKTGGKISTVFTPVANGTFTATMIIKSGDVKKEVALKGSSTVSVEELANNTHIFSYNKTITVELNNITDANITVFDITGKMIANTAAINTITTIDVKSNSGIYIVNVVANGSKVIKKVVIK